MNDEVIRVRKLKEIPIAQRHEKLLEFEKAAKIYKELGMDDSYCVDLNLGSLGKSSHLNAGTRWFIF